MISKGCLEILLVALALESYLDSSCQLGPTSSVAPSRVVVGGGPTLSSSASGIFFRGDDQSPAPVSSLSGTVRSGPVPASCDMNRMVPNSAANSSGPSVGASSLVTDANSALSGGPQLQRSASINTESYTRLPASPMSFSSNNISGSSPMDGSSIVQQSSHQEPMQKQGASSVTSQSTLQDHLGNLLHVHKKPRVDMRQEDVHQHAIQQFLHRQDSMQLQGHPNPQLQAMIQQQQRYARKAAAAVATDVAVLAADAACSVLSAPTADEEQLSAAGIP
ncbi:hypothetical protein J5N97_025245 [Dioscorea zingiberensis]|uniref:Uncharacterized protein n=1 Tax=Dioscorea zingiberensis TaxID=325984 RepID=A0A9D5H9U2_9LILI|nr:hypothetical protein J5N97_025245 [Dioscorea zingiberensis]